MQAVEATYGGVGSEQRVFTREGEALAARMQDSIDGIKIEERQAAAEIESVGKYEPKLTENGIPADVLAKLLPGDDVLELTESKVAGGLGYRFVKPRVRCRELRMCLDCARYSHGNYCCENQT